MATFEAYVQGTEQSPLAQLREELHSHTLLRLEQEQEKDKRTMTTEQQNVALRQKHASLLTHVQHLDQKIKGFITDDLHLRQTLSMLIMQVELQSIKQHESLQDLSSHAAATVAEAAAPDEVFSAASDAVASGKSLPQLWEEQQLPSGAVAPGVGTGTSGKPVLITKEDVNKYTKQA